MSPIIKVCGMRDAENIREVERIGIDLMGFICWERSPRFVSEVPSYLPKCPRVGVFVNPTLDFVSECCKAFGFSYIQLHGNESPEFCQEVRQQTGLKIIKAFSIENSTGAMEASPLRGGLVGSYEGIADLFLFDTKGKSIGGNGEKFDWSVLEDYHDDTPFLLSGGIGPEDAERLKHWRHPKCIGIDINSCFETAPGIKDVAAIAKFTSKLKS
ncbi:MAG: phosphoribosylanthranilate isomerase [Bacteroidaceae bacterium]|nr:phosphoribosylanthranilate isomerase [Bacteroidaceae bacterium]